MLICYSYFRKDNNEQEKYSRNCNFNHFNGDDFKRMQCGKYRAGSI